MSDYPEITPDNKFDESADVYYLDVTNFICVLTPPHGMDIEPLDPNYFYITSGDAIQKAEYMQKIYWKYAGRARHTLKSMKKTTKNAIEFERLCWKQAGNCARLINSLRRARGEKVFLETEWDEGRLKCCAKNPRIKQTEDL